MNASIAEYLVHFSNVLMLVSYSVRDLVSDAGRRAS
jgi:hypothetical protein